MAFLMFFAAAIVASWIDVWRKEAAGRRQRRVAEKRQVQLLKAAVAKMRVPGRYASISFSARGEQAAVLLDRLEAS
jgi:hypothetical protein